MSGAAARTLFEKRKARKQLSIERGWGIDKKGDQIGMLEIRDLELQDHYKSRRWWEIQ